MKRFFMSLILMLSIFSIVTAHPFKSEKELQDFYISIDKEVEKVRQFEKQLANFTEDQFNENKKAVQLMVNDILKNMWGENAIIWR